MNAVVTQLTSTFSAEALWEIFGTIIPFVGVVTLVALGWYLVKRQTKKASKLKGGA